MPAGKAARGRPVRGEPRGQHHRGGDPQRQQGVCAHEDQEWQGGAHSGGDAAFDVCCIVFVTIYSTVDVK